MSSSPKKPKFFQLISYISQLFLKRTHKIEVQTIPEKSVIDIGGGGEGIIARIGKERVTAVDKFQSEIDEAKPKAPEAKWIIADARNLEFPNEHFDHATAFFSFMYMSNKDKEDIIREVKRVIKGGGEFWIWDAVIRKTKGVFLIKIKVILPDKQVVKTAYGVSSKVQKIDSISSLLEDEGFRVEIIESKKNWYFLKAKK
jgi:ubiquinone/menaquinone biosynthesis C-methylase UbiE